MASAANRAEPKVQRRTSDMVSIRVPLTTRAKIDSAAKALGKTRTDFILDTVREKAENIILDQRMFELDEAESAALRSILENPPQALDALRALMTSKAPWE